MSELTNTRIPPFDATPMPLTSLTSLTALDVTPSTLLEMFGWFVGLCLIAAAVVLLAPENRR